MLPHPTPSMEPPFFMQASMEKRRSHHLVSPSFLDIVRSNVHTPGPVSKFLSVWHFI